MKKTYKLAIEEKVIVWKRTLVEVDANSEREALEKSLDYINNQRVEDISLDSEEYIYETEEKMAPEDNDGCSTLEIFNKYPYIEENSIYNNEIEEIKRFLKVDNHEL